MGESDQLLILRDHILVVIKEAYLHRVKVAFCFALVSLLMLAIGLYYPKTFSTSITLFADKSNIIAPLLRGQAATTNITDHSRVVRETINSPRLLRKVVDQSGILQGHETPAAIGQIIENLRSALLVESLGARYIKVTYNSVKAENSYRVVNAIVDEFLQDSANSQKAESRSAYEFIDSQVKNYREQLQTAEERLKVFSSSNEDGNKQTVERRLTQLRSNIESMDLDIEGIRTRITSLQQELKREDRYANKRYKADVFRENLRRAQQNMDGLLLNYTNTHPDVITLRYQMKDIEQQIIAAETDDAEPNETQSEISLNPLYEGIRSQIAEATVELKSKLKRRTSTATLMVKERNRLKRVAENQAERSELTRDYNVTMRIYEDMLDRKEKARLSMILDIEGKGVNFKIQEPAIYPLTPSGLRFVYFFLAGPIIGFLIPLLLLVAYVVVDPRIRFARLLEYDLDVPLLGVVPHINTPFSVRIFRIDVIIVCCLFLLVVGIYGTAAAIKLSGAS